MSINRIVILVVVIGYLVVNITMQVDFFAGRDIFAKYQVASTTAEALRIAQKAYYAKTAFLLLLLILLTIGRSFSLALALSFSAYATLMTIFFGLTLPTTLYLVAAVALLGSYVVDRRRPG